VSALDILPSNSSTDSINSLFFPTQPARQDPDTKCGVSRAEVEVEESGTLSFMKVAVSNDVEGTSLSTTILDWIKLLSGSSQAIAARWELLPFPQDLLANRDKMPSYLLPSSKLIDEGTKRFNRLGEFGKSDCEEECRCYGPTSESKEDFDRRLAVIVLVKTKEEDQFADDLVMSSVPDEPAVSTSVTDGSFSSSLRGCLDAYGELDHRRDYEKLIKSATDLKSLEVTKDVARLRECLEDSVVMIKRETELVRNGGLGTSKAIDLLRFTTQYFMSALHISKKHEECYKLRTLSESLVNLRHAICEKCEDAREECEAYDFLFVDYPTVFRYLDCLDDAEFVKGLEMNPRPVLKEFLISLYRVAEDEQVPDFMKPNENIRLTLETLCGYAKIDAKTKPQPKGGQLLVDDNRHSFSYRHEVARSLGWPG